MKYIQALIILTFVLTFSSCAKDPSADNCSKPDLSISDDGTGKVFINPTLAYDFVEIEYGINEFSQGNGTKTNNTSISGFGTGSYDFYLRGNCGGSEWSEWSDVKSIYINNGGAGPNPNCSKPTNLSNSEGWGQSEGIMSLNWDDGNSPVSGYFELEYGPAGFAIGSGEKVTVNDSYYSDGAFATNTTYDVYVRANCGGSEFSDYSDVHSFYASENYNRCLPPINVVVNRNGSNINFTFVPNGEVEYEYTLVYNGSSVTSGTLSTLNTSIYAASGGWSGVSSSTRQFYIRAICRDGGRSDWYTVTVP